MVAFLHAVVFMTLLGEQIGRAEHFDAPRHDSRIVNIAVAVLGGPVFYVVRPEWTFWLRRYVGDDLWIVVLLAALNALCWGAAVVAAVCWWRRRRRPIRGHALGVLATVASITVCFAACNDPISQSHIDANVRSAKQFDGVLERDLRNYFQAGRWSRMTADAIRARSSVRS